MSVRVYCVDCDLVFWEGSLINWAVELARNPDNKPPKWFLKACEHYKIHRNIVTEYPNQTVPLKVGG